MPPRTDFATMRCPVARTMAVVGERWSILVLREAFYGATRFDEFQRNLGIAPNILSARLRSLTQHGVLEKLPAARGKAGAAAPEAPTPQAPAPQAPAPQAPAPTGAASRAPTPDSAITGAGLDTAVPGIGGAGTPIPKVAATGTPGGYRITAKGRDFFPAFLALKRWGDRWMTDDRGPLILLEERTTGREVTAPPLLASNGQPLTPEQVRVRPGPGAGPGLRARFTPKEDQDA